MRRTPINPPAVIKNMFELYPYVIHYLDALCVDCDYYTLPEIHAEYFTRGEIRCAFLKRLNLLIADEIIKLTAMREEFARLLPQPIAEEFIEHF
jgi:hypothetical protein